MSEKKLKRLSEKIVKITPEDIFQKVYNIHPILKFIILLLLFGSVSTLSIYNVLKHEPIAVQTDFSKKNDSFYNFTVNKQFNINNDLYNIITYTTPDGWYASLWHSDSQTESNKELITNDISITHPISIGQIVSYFEELGEPIQSLEIINNDTLKINDKEVTGKPYNTQITKIMINDEEVVLDKFYNVLLQQRGQLDLLNRYSIPTSDIAIKYVSSKGTVEFIYGGRIWGFITQNNESEEVRLVWQNLN